MDVTFGNYDAEGYSISNLALGGIKKKIFFGIPVDSGMSPNFLLSMTRMCVQLTNEKIEFVINFLANDSLVTRARNNLVGQFLLQRDCSHFMFIDSDIGFDTNSVLRLLNSDKDVSSVCYPLKGFDWDSVLAESQKPGATADKLKKAATKFVVNVIDEECPSSSQPVRDFFLSVCETGTGFLMIKRKVFYELILHYPQDEYVPDNSVLKAQCLQYNLKCYYMFFDTLIDPKSKRLLSEDWGFCRKWRKVGGEIFVDSSGVLTHTGPITFEGNLNEFLIMKNYLKP